MTILSELNDCAPKDIIAVIGPKYAETLRKKQGKSTTVYDETTGKVYFSMTQASEAIGCRGITDVAREFAKHGSDRINIMGHTLRRERR